MEKTYPLQEREMTRLGQLDQERTQTLATVGALSLDMEQAKKNLESITERQRAFVQQALTTRGIEQYENARCAQGHIFVTYSEAQAKELPLEATPVPASPERVNGPYTSAKE